MRLSESAKEYINIFLNNVRSDIEIINSELNRSEVDIHELIICVDQLTQRRNRFVDVLSYLEAEGEIIRR